MKGLYIININYLLFRTHTLILCKNKKTWATSKTLCEFFLQKTEIHLLKRMGGYHHLMP